MLKYVMFIGLYYFCEDGRMSFCYVYVLRACFRNHPKVAVRHCLICKLLMEYHYTITMSLTAREFYVVVEPGADSRPDCSRMLIVVVICPTITENKITLNAPTTLTPVE